MQCAGDSSEQILPFLTADLRTSRLVELLTAYHDTTLIQMTRCTTWYKERVLGELYPTRKTLSGLNF